jgi:flagellar assembly protein FliH
MSNLLKGGAAASSAPGELDEEDLIRLAVKIAGRIVRAELQLAPEKIVEIARATIAAAGARAGRTLVVHPDDAALVARLGVPVRTDETIERGGCVVESPLGRADARLETSLAAIERALLAP